MDIQYFNSASGHSYFFSLVVKNKKMVIERVFWDKPDADQGQKDFISLVYLPRFVSSIVAKGFVLSSELE